MKKWFGKRSPKKRSSGRPRRRFHNFISGIYDRLPKRLQRFLYNKYVAGAVVLLVVIIVVVLIALVPSATGQAASAKDRDKDASGEVIYVFDEMGNKVVASEVEDDSIVLQNEKEVVEDPVTLAYNANTRDGYMNNCIFLGDSRTVAMVSYGIISDSNVLAKVGISHWQVSSTTFVQNSGSRFTLSDFLRAKKESVIYVCYGVNGMNGMAEDKYKQTYTDLVDKIISLAGDRHVVLMSIWPVNDNGRYKGSVKNEWVNKYNDFLYNMAVEKGLHYLDVASILKDENGSIKKEYDSGDGLHYRASAYKDILNYIIHHPVPGVSDEGEFVVHYVQPRGEYKDIMTETPVLPEMTQLIDGTIPIITGMPAEGVEPTATPNPEETPTPTPEPTPTPKPEPTKDPEPTSDPDPYEDPEPTEEPTPTPEPTEVPVPVEPEEPEETEETAPSPEEQASE
ncbi:MAG: hypothetical protein K6E63_07415 [Lachnospiraceae bacterium]|nr:hypothetical protein [Lachnospiraceae bacterium]